MLIRPFALILLVVGAGACSENHPLPKDDNAEVIYNHWSRPSLAAFKIFDEGPHFDAKARPALTLTDRGLGGRPGHNHGGNYTAWKFAAPKSRSWELRATFQLPASAAYSNSGFFFLMQDPRKCRGPEASRAQREAETRRDEIGDAPTELEYFGYELQIIAGHASHYIPPENRGAGAFYGVPLNTNPTAIDAGTQDIAQPYTLSMGQSYELIVHASRNLEHLELKSFFRNLETERRPTRVSTFVVPTAAENSARGGTEPTLYLQAFNNNGTTSQLPIFRDIRIVHLD
ncbi:MAG TPA: hypothetical protein VM901_07650 [Bdellovibrionota bacterium]|nr:hypothetical protein [Bdellovibrionota bacterium]